jgi:AAA domain
MCRPSSGRRRHRRRRAQVLQVVSFLALDLAVAVAAGVPCLRRFAVPDPGRVLLYAAEDAHPIVRRRLEAIAAGALVSWIPKGQDSLATRVVSGDLDPGLVASCAKEVPSRKRDGERDEKRGRPSNVLTAA